MSPIISDAGGPPLSQFFSFVVGLTAAATLIGIVAVSTGLLNVPWPSGIRGVITFPVIAR